MSRRPEGFPESEIKEFMPAIKASPFRGTERLGRKKGGLTNTTVMVV